MKKLYNIIISMKTMVIFTLLFAFFSAAGTFIENDFGTETAWADIYSTRWFEFIMLILAINLIGNIFRFKLYKKDKLGAFVFHLGFIVILIGAAITRYIGYEGIMHIREGYSSDHITTNYNYILFGAKKDGKVYFVDKKILLSKLSSNDFKIDLNIDGKVATLKYKQYFPYAKNKIVSDPDGEAMINMMVLTSMGKPQNITLKSKDIYDKDGVKIGLNNDNSDINIYTKDGKFYFKSKLPIKWMKMADRSSGEFEVGKEYPLEGKKFYDLGSLKFVPREFYEHASIKLVNEKDKTSGGRMMKSAQKEALLASLEYDGKKEDITLFGFGKGSLGIPAQKEIDGVKFNIRWGAKEIQIPFTIHLKDFELKRYPGSMSPASYASEVVLIDKSRGVNMPYRIFMNHVLDYKNYRFFQSSYDTDEKGTVLSVNHDPGKIPTYIGYLMLAIGFIMTLFNPKSRFRKLANRVKEDSLKTATLLLFVLLSIYSPNLKADSLDEALKAAKAYDKEHASKFGDLLIQTMGGRIKTIDTFANEVMLKLHKSTTAYGMDEDQIMLGMITSPDTWQEIPFIKVKHTRIRKILGLKDGQKYASFNDFFVDKRVYKLASYIQESFQKPPIKRNEFDRSVIKTDEKLNIMYMIFTGEILKLIPKVNDPSNKWYDIKSAIGTFPKDESDLIRTMIVNYFRSIDEAKKSGDWSKANKNLKKLQDYQYKVSSSIIPDRNRLQAEKWFRKISATNKLIFVYMLIGLIMVGIVLYNIVKQNSQKTRRVFKVIKTIFIIAFIIHTLILASRWYIGGHAPWSNAYEAMLYVSWAMALSGVIFMRYSPIIPALSAIVAGSTLATTFFNEMNPQITNLVPVLKSYWLNIHVSVITASYGFFALSAMLGLFTLFLFIIRKENNKNIDLAITETTRLNEMTAIIGLMMLTIGNFLGGVWANESWGRYWSWDPKETWAWISILVYASVLHLRFIPYFNKNYEYKFSTATVLAISSIVMTFVGVNYYLSGMHSYAAGEPIPVPKYLYVIVGTIFTIILISGFKARRWIKR